MLELIGGILASLAVLWLMLLGLFIMLHAIWPKAIEHFFKTTRNLMVFIITLPFKPWRKISNRLK